MAIRTREKSVRVDRNLVAVPRYQIRRRESRRHMAKDVAKGIFYIAGVGALVALIANLDDIKSSKEVKDHWWLIPIATLAIGWLLKKRGHPYAAAVIAVGGAMLASEYGKQAKAQQAQAQQQQAPVQKVPPLPPPPKPQPQPQPFAPKGSGETGAPFGAPGGFNMLPTPDGGLLLRAPDGQIIRISRAELGPVNQAATRVVQSPAFRRVA